MNIAEIRIASAGYDAHSDTVSQIEFTVQAGQLVGLIGPNGAGKSTTVKAIMGLLQHMQGEIVVHGSGRYAYIPEQPVFYDELTLWEHLLLAAASYELDSKQFETKADALLERFRLLDAKHRYPAAFSKGMQQKMMLIIGFLAEPDLFIVDEPFVGLDPKATKDFLDLLDEALQNGACAIMSTHVLDTAEKICDAFVLINEGTMVAQGDMEHIRQLSGLQEGSLFECFHELV